MKCRIVLSFIFAILFVLSSSVMAEATALDQRATPVSGYIDEAMATPIGILSEEEQRQLAIQDCTSCPVPYHFNLTGHTHEITQITSRYRGEVSRGVVAETTRRVDTTGQLSYEMGRSVSNSYSVSISFEKNVISSTLGFDVTYSKTETASYSVDVPVNMMASITLYDIYNVTEFDVKTTYIYDTIPLTYTYEYGNGWAQQWSNFGFSASIW